MIVTTLSIIPVITEVKVEETTSLPDHPRAIIQDIGENAPQNNKWSI
jgi:hypothetical protein